MTLIYDDGGVVIYHGNAPEILRCLPGESVDCCITSPPYYGLRDYGTAEWTGGLPDCDHTYNHGTQGKTGQRADRTFTAQAVYKHDCKKCGAIRVDEQIGLERTYPEYIAKLVEIFREVRRILKPEGNCWLNLGDSFATGAGAVGECPGGGKQGERWRGHDVSITEQRKRDRESYRGAPEKDPRSVGIGPLTQMNRLAQPGLKPKDLMMIPARVAIALQADGWYLRSDIVWQKVAPMPESVTDRPTRSHEFIFLLAKSEKYYYDSEAIKEPSVAGHPSGNGYKRDARLSFADKNGAALDEPWKPQGKHSRTDKQAAGRRITEGVARARAAGGNHDSPFGDTRNKRDVWTVNTDPFPEAHFATFPPALILPCVLAGCPLGGTILDPFGGAMTTMLVAQENGRRGISMDLNRKYIEMGIRRLSQNVLPFHSPVDPAPVPDESTESFEASAALYEAHRQVIT